MDEEVFWRDGKEGVSVAYLLHSAWDLMSGMWWDVVGVSWLTLVGCRPIAAALSVLLIGVLGVVLRPGRNGKV